MDLNIYLRTPLKNFAIEMEQVLQENDSKGGWENCEYDYLTVKLEKSFDALLDAIIDPKTTVEDCQKECVDLANYAMMIHRNLSRQKTKKAKPA